jgi:hypothetical protein
MPHPPSIGTVDGGPDTQDGITQNPNAAAVTGFNASNQAAGLIAGPEPLFKSTVGVFGRSNSTGVFGFSDKAGGGTGVVGNTNAGSGIGVHGATSTGVGILGTSNASGPAGRFEGDVEVTGDIRLINADCAEDFDISDVELVEPGTVMVIEDDGTLRPSRVAYDRHVAGVVSGASNHRPALVLGRGGAAKDRMPVALLGKVYCKVDASAEPISVGDLLTTSNTLGHAMKAKDPTKAFGAVIGKALCRLESGQGLIPILIALQ